MPLTFKTEMRKEYLYVLIDGAFDFSSLIQSLDVILDAVEQRQATKVLVDVRKISGAPNDQERIHYGTIGAEKYLERLNAKKIKPCRFAYLGNYPQIDRARLGEATAVNRGMNIKTSNDIAAAFDWLVVKRDMD